MGVIPSRVLVHIATPVGYAEDDAAQWVEGEPGGAPEPVDGLAFACVLFLPGPGGEQQNEFRPKTVRQPTLLTNAFRDVVRAGLDADGSAIVFGPDEELRIGAPELAPWVGAEVGRWLVVGAPQPFGPPGRVYGLQATLRAVKD